LKLSHVFRECDLRNTQGRNEGEVVLIVLELWEKVDQEEILEISMA
jgi:hypothetical protein